MPKITYPNCSPYAATPQTSSYLSKFKFRSIPPDAGDTPYTLLPEHEHSPRKLSFDLYGTPVWWWVFCVRNPALRWDPVFSLLAGMTILVPSADYLRRIVGT